MVTRRTVLAALPFCVWGNAQGRKHKAKKRKKQDDGQWKNTVTIQASTFGEGRGFHTIVPTGEGFAIADYFGACVARFDRNGGFLGDLGSFPELSALAYDGNYYVGHANTLQKLSPDGTVLARYGHPDWHVWYWCAGVEGNRLYLTSNDGYVYVHDASTLDLLTQIGSGPGGGYGALGVGPNSVAPRAITPHQGSLWIADPGNDLIQRWDTGGGFLSQFAVPRGSGVRSLVFSGESLWVSHEFGNKAIRYSQDGTPLEEIRFTEAWGLNVVAGRLWLSSDSPGREIRAYERTRP